MTSSKTVTRENYSKNFNNKESLSKNRNLQMNEQFQQQIITSACTSVHVGARKI